MNPLMAPAKVLLQQGHVVKFACYEELRWKFEAAGERNSSSSSSSP
jgi:UDP:flavonoid glycosyltransferase YjiC (YdhE family)